MSEPDERLDTDDWRLVKAGETAPLKGGHGSWVETDHPAVVACMGSAPTCAANGCQLEAADARVQALEAEKAGMIEQAKKVVDFHRDMAARFAEDRDEKKHALRAAEARVQALTTQKDGAYSERDQLVAALSKCFPSWLGYHAGGEWDEDWRNIVFVELPTGQASWHIHDSELPLFAHLKPGGAGCIWDGHDTPEKYRRLAALVAEPRREEERE